MAVPPLDPPLLLAFVLAAFATGALAGIGGPGGALLVAALFAVLGLRIVYEEARGIDPVVALDARSLAGVVVLVVLGFAVGFAGGFTGIGGPAIATPALVALGVPALVAIGTAQVQSLAVTSATAAAYLSRGTVRASLVLVLAPAFVAGIVAGWYVAHRVTATRLRLAIGAALLLLAPLIAL